MFIIPSIDLSMKLSLSEVFVSNIIVTMVISDKFCCKHVLFTTLSDFLSTTTRVTSVKYKKFLLDSFSVAKFGIAPHIFGRLTKESISKCKQSKRTSFCSEGRSSARLLSERHLILGRALARAALPDNMHSCYSTKLKVLLVVKAKYCYCWH